jgi:type I site-specific restriction endonuclease
MDQKQLSERDICTKYITPALERSGWDILTQIREEFSLTDGRILVRGKLHARAKSKRAGTGKTFTAFQIIWRLWKSKAKKRILFLAELPRKLMKFLISTILAS